MRKIYVAGPLFTEGERHLLEGIDALCQECGFTTYLPHRDAGVFDREDDSSNIIFQKDLQQLNESAFVVAVLNGLDMDSGTAWELGYFYSTGKPIVAYLSDSRIFTPRLQINPMIINSIAHLTRTHEELRVILKTL